MKILFSPIGKTDPIANLYDGSMLHLCRIEKPDVVVLYITDTFLKYHNQDDRYRRSVELLGERLGHKFVVETELRPDIKDAHKIEGFFEDFEMIFETIYKKYGSDASLIVNSTQGTPVMKAALITICAMSNHHIHLKQVSNDTGDVNRYVENLEQYDLEEYWELNIDNQDEAANRTFDVDITSFNKRIQKEVISRQIAVYDYHAAWMVAQLISDTLHPEVLTLLKIALERTRLNKNKYLPESKHKANKEIIPYRNDEQILLYEYALWLRMKQMRGDYLDFVRGLSPLLFSLCVYALKTIYKINIYDFCDLRKNTWYLSVDKLRHTAMNGEGLLKHLNASFNGDFKPGYLKEIYMLRILEFYNRDSDNKPVIQDLQDLLGIAKDVRNEAAHQIIFLDDDEIKKKSGYTSAEILQKIKDALQHLGMKVGDDGYWNSYDCLNQKINELLRV